MVLANQVTNSFSHIVSKVNITARNFDFCMEAEKNVLKKNRDEYFMTRTNKLRTTTENKRKDNVA